MVKITIESRGKNYVDEGEAVLAFTVKADQEISGDEIASPISAHLCGEGNQTLVLKNVCTSLGTMANQLYKRQATRALAYAKMLDAFQMGFEGRNVEVSDGREKPCGCDCCPMEDEEDGEDGKEAD